MAVSRFENTVETFALDVDEGTLTPRFASDLKPIFFWHDFFYLFLLSMQGFNGAPGRGRRPHLRRYHQKLKICSNFNWLFFAEKRA